jgi:hypothetical protein
VNASRSDHKASAVIIAVATMMILGELGIQI